ncbi:MAG: thymidine kinase [Planctomycetes bacterium]|nr:thymidine kinase [Planctomycetota bacterium]
MNHARYNRIELICGPMFSGKTTALIQRLEAARVAGRKAMAFKPALDTRYSRDELVSHDGLKLVGKCVVDVQEILQAVDTADVVGIDEIQFFDGALVDVCVTAADRGIGVILAGVDLDHRGRPFEVVEQCEAAAGLVTRLVARCARCGDVARRTQRLVPGDARIVVGGSGAYEPRCDRCFAPPD